MQQKITKDKALSKAMGYCAYQERCSVEVQERLKKWGVEKENISEIIKQLIENKFIDDQRYAIAFVSGKFRIKKWGRIKISVELRAKGIERETILNSLKEISDHAYMQSLKKLAVDKIRITKGKSDYIVQNKVANYLQRKGYESDLIWKTIKNLMS